MSGLEWTNSRPKLPGKYWYFDTSLDEAIIMTVKPGGVDNILWADGGEYLFPIEEFDETDECIHSKEWWSLNPIAVPNIPYVDYEQDCDCVSCRE